MGKREKEVGWEEGGGEQCMHTLVKAIMSKGQHIRAMSACQRMPKYNSEKKKQDVLHHTFIPSSSIQLAQILLNFSRQLRLA